MNVTVEQQILTLSLFDPIYQCTSDVGKNI